MILYPAIDLIAGRCVRLSQGDFARETRYDESPAVALERFASDGATWAHVVDLDGAKAREPRQHGLIATLARSAALKLQVAGGVRTPDHVAALLEAGATRIVVGSLAVDDPAAFTALLDRFGPDALTLALDVRLDGTHAQVVTHGWTDRSGKTLDTVLARFPAVRHLLVTDVGRDGMLAGPNLPLIEAVAALNPEIAVQASGGVASLHDFPHLKQMGAAGVIVGKALWEGRFTVREAVRACR